MMERLTLFFYHKFNVTMPIILKFKKFDESCLLPKAARMAYGNAIMP